VPMSSASSRKVGLAYRQHWLSLLIVYVFYVFAEKKDGYLDPGSSKHYQSWSAARYCQVECRRHRFHYVKVLICTCTRLTHLQYDALLITHNAPFLPGIIMSSVKNI